MGILTETGREREPMIISPQALTDLLATDFMARFFEGHTGGERTENKELKNACPIKAS